MTTKSKQTKRTSKARAGSLQRLVRTSIKTHHFVLGVKTNGTRKDAERAVLASFSLRNPDGCEFYLRDLSKEEWMAGAKVGMSTALDLVARQVEDLRKTCRSLLSPNAKLTEAAGEKP